MLKKFNFKLQSVLNLVLFKRDITQQELSKLLEELNREKEKLNDMKTEFEAKKNELTQTMKREIIIGKIHIFNSYLESLNKKIAETKKVIIMMGNMAAKKRMELEKIEKDRKVLEKIKEKKIDEYKKDLLMQDQKILDEIASQRFVINNEGFENGNQMYW
jgi:flagellar FliJ protein